MICPECKNKNFEQTEDVRKPLLHEGKESYDTVNYRRYFCRQCGYAFITTETFERAVKIRRNIQRDLFKSGSK